MLIMLLHEFGHGIHDLVSKTKYARFHGPSGTPVDFGEAPSQMLENWCWDLSLLEKMSRHYSYLSPEYYEVWKKSSEDKPQPPEVLPDAMINSMIGNRYMGATIHLLEQMVFAYFDLAVYHAKSHEDLINTNISAVYGRILREVYPLERPLNKEDDWGCGQGAFGNIVTVDYDAGYYAYTWYVLSPTNYFRITCLRYDPGRKCTPMIYIIRFSKTIPLIPRKGSVIVRRF